MFGIGKILNLNILGGGSSISYKSKSKTTTTTEKSIFFDAEFTKMDTLKIGNQYICASESHTRLYGKSDEKKSLTNVSLKVFCSSVSTLSEKDKKLFGLGIVHFYKPSNDGDFEYQEPVLKVHLFLKDIELVELKSCIERGYIPCSLNLQLNDDDHLTYGSMPDGRDMIWKLNIPNDEKKYYSSNYLYCSEANFRFPKAEPSASEDDYRQDKNNAVKEQELQRSLKINQIQNTLYFIAIVLIIILIK